MLANEGGAVSDVEIEPGGWIRGGRVNSCLEDTAGGWLQVQKVNKSPATGKVTSVKVWGVHTGYSKESGYTKRETKPVLVNVDVERLPESAYRAPTDEERREFKASKAANKTKAASLINPTDSDAEKLQSVWNSLTTREGAKVEKWTQAKYSYLSKGDMLRTVSCHADGRPGGNAFKVRSRWYIGGADSVVVLSDKPQKPLPLEIQQEETLCEPEPAAVVEVKPSPAAVSGVRQSVLF
jgi:hypothetical protein